MRCLYILPCKAYHSNAFKFHDFASFYECFTLRSVLQKPLRSSPIIPQLVHLLRETTSFSADKYSKVDIDVVLIKLLSQKFVDRIQFRSQSNRFARNLPCIPRVKYCLSNLYRNC